MRRGTRAAWKCVQQGGTGPWKSSRQDAYKTGARPCSMPEMIVWIITQIDAEINSKNCMAQLFLRGPVSRRSRSYRAYPGNLIDFHRLFRYFLKDSGGHYEIYFIPIVASGILHRRAAGVPIPSRVRRDARRCENERSMPNSHGNDDLLSLVSRCCHRRCCR